MGFAVQPLLRPNATIRCDPADLPAIKPMQNVILLLNGLDRKFSVATQIAAIEEQEGAEPFVQVDSRILAK